MAYLISFLEGIITFISPCLLPMLPIYLVYFAGGSEGSEKSQKTVTNALGFVLGFTIVFVTMGAFSAAIGSLLTNHRTAVNVVSGLVVIVFGLNFMGFLNIGFLNSTKKLGTQIRPMGFFSTLLFGLVFALGWTPCVGAFLGSALLLASQQGSVAQGVLMLLAYSLGLGIPFVLSAVLIDKLKGAFGFIKRHYTMVNRICGALLVVVGILMLTGYMGILLEKLTF